MKNCKSNQPGRSEERRRLCGLIAVALLLAAAGPAIDKTGWPDKITVGITPALGVEKTRQKYQPLIAHLEKSLGIKVEALVPNDYLMMVMGLASRAIDFGYMSPNTYMLAKDQTTCELLALELDREGKPGYHSILIASKASGIKTLDQAQGKILAFTSSDSTSGFMVPSNYFVKELKTTPGKFASQVVFAGSHLEVISGVADGKSGFGATNDLDLARSGDPNGFVTLWKSEMIPGAPFVARKDLPESLKKAFLEALLSLSQDKAALKEIGIGGYIPAKDSDFNELRRLSNQKSAAP